MVNILCTYKLYQVVEFMFRQWTWNLDRTASHTTPSSITFPASSITLVPWPLSWTIFFKQISGKYSHPRDWKITSEGPHIAKFTYFCLTRTSDFRSFYRPQWAISKMQPDLCNTASWEALHKRITTLDRYRLRNWQFTTPLSVDPVQNWQPFTTLTKLEYFSKEQPSSSDTGLK